MYVYYELIVFLYVGANTFCIFDFSDIFQYPKLSMLCLLLIFVYFNEYESQLESLIARKSQNRKIIATLAKIENRCDSVLLRLGAFNNLRIEWEEPARSMLHVVDALTFELDHLKVQCIFSKDDPVVNFSFTLLLFPIFMVLLAVGLSAGKLVGGTGLSLSNYFNAVGLVATMIFISITILVLRPLHCIGNPNGSSSMASKRAVVCWDSQEHNWLVVLALLAILVYPCTILAVVVQITVRYPRLVVSGNGVGTIVHYRFLFSRFSAPCYFWGVPNLLRNLLISLAPVIFSDSSFWQVVSIQFIILTNLICTSRFMPWRTGISNKSDLGTCFALAMFIMIAGLRIDVDGDDIGVIHAIIATNCVIAIVVMISWVVGYSLFLRRAANKFGAFLCHHKECAGCLARYFKLKIAAYSNSEIFLDSDHLQKLDLLFDMVRSSTRNLVLLETKMVLTRPWCAGEITTAFVNHTLIVRVSCDDFVAPDERFLDELENLWSEAQQGMLGQYGISVPMVQDAYRFLANLETIVLKRYEEFSQHMVVIQLVVEKCNIQTSICSIPQMRSSDRDGTISLGIDTMTFSHSASFTHSATSIIVAGAGWDAEMRCSCEVLALMMQTQTKVVVSAVHSAEHAAEHLATASIFVAVLSKGLLQDSRFAAILFRAEHMRQDEPLEITAVLADTNFDFPGACLFLQKYNLCLISVSEPACLEAFHFGVSLFGEFDSLVGWIKHN